MLKFSTVRNCLRRLRARAEGAAADAEQETRCGVLVIDAKDDEEFARLTANMREAAPGHVGFLVVPRQHSMEEWLEKHAYIDETKNQDIK